MATDKARAKMILELFLDYRRNKLDWDTLTIKIREHCLHAQYDYPYRNERL